MKKLAKKAAVVCMSAFMTTGLLAGCGSKELDGQQTVVTVGKTDVSAGLVSLAVRYNQAQTNYYYQMTGLGDGEIWDRDGNTKGKTYGDETRTSILETVEKMVVMRDHAKDYGLTLSKDQQDQIKKTAEAFIKGNDAKVLKKMGVAQKEVEEYLELYTYYTMGRKAVTKDQKIEISDKEANQSTISYVFAKTDKLDKEGKAAVKKKMQAVLDEIKASSDPSSLDFENFEKKDKTLSATKASFGADDATLDVTVKEAAKTLKDGEVFPRLIEGSIGIFIVRMDQTKDDKETAVKKEQLLEEKTSQIYDDILKGWVKEAGASIHKGIWKKITLTDTEKYVMNMAASGGDASGDAAK